MAPEHSQPYPLSAPAAAPSLSKVLPGSHSERSPREATPHLPSYGLRPFAASTTSPSSPALLSGAGRRAASSFPAQLQPELLPRGGASQGLTFCTQRRGRAATPPSGSHHLPAAPPGEREREEEPPPKSRNRPVRLATSSTLYTDFGTASLASQTSQEGRDSRVLEVYDYVSGGGACNNFSNERLLLFQLLLMTQEEVT